jgi:hypothetical protein
MATAANRAASATPPATGAAPVTAETARRMRWLDAFGVVVSGVCAVHCVVVAVFLATLPLAGAALISDPRVETTFIGAALVLGAVSLGLGFGRVHRDPRPLSAFGVGVGLLLGARSAVAPNSAAEVAIVVAGAACITVGHWWNRRLLHRHAACGLGHSHERPHLI